MKKPSRIVATDDVCGSLTTISVFTATATATPYHFYHRSGLSPSENSQPNSISAG